MTTTRPTDTFVCRTIPTQKTPGKKAGSAATEPSFLR